MADYISFFSARTTIMTQNNIKFFIASIFSIASVTAFGMDDLGKTSAYAPSKLGNVQIVHTDKKFHVIQNGNMHAVQNAWIDKDIRGIETKQLAKYLKHGNLLYINKAENGEFSINAHNRVNGGGAIGAWIGSTLGYGTVTFLGHGTIHLVSACTGPFYTATAATLTQMMTIPIHSAACAAGVAGGIAGGVATGPV